MMTKTYGDAKKDLHDETVPDCTGTRERWDSDRRG